MSGSGHEDETPLAHYEDEGSGEVPIVLLPGGSLDVSYLKPLAKALADAGHRVVRIDARPHTSDSLTMHDLANDVVAVMDALDLPPSWIAGHAFGNRVARTVALDYPDRAQGVILLAAGGTVTPSPEAQHALKVAFSNATDEEGEQAMTYMVGSPDEATAAWHAIKPARDPKVGAQQRAANLATPEDEWARIVDGTPAIIIQGSHDQIAPPANGEQLAEKNPDNTTLLSIDGAGHLFPFLRPEDTADLIRAHI